jgi:signal transduction histidine kinase
MIEVADLRPLELFRGLTDEQLADLIAGGTTVTMHVGEVLFREGQPADFWWVLVEGGVEIARHVGREDVVVARMDVPGRWAGGFRAWDEHGTYLATGRCVQEGRMLKVPSEVLRDCAQAWFPFGTHLISGLTHTARSIEATARQRDSLITLGTLAAGIAHEINNPAAAATREVVALERTADTLLTSLRRLADDEISADQFAALDTLRQEIKPPQERLDPLTQADLEQDLAIWLEQHGVASAWTLAPALAANGVDVAWCERAASALGPSALLPALDWIVSTLTLRTNLANLQESTRRIVELVGSVRSYTQMDRGSWQRVDVVEGIESTLTMLGFRLAEGVDVVREYVPDRPLVEAYAGELNQVWTNLIGNALDAMDGSGTLTLRVQPDGDEMVVEVGDTGVGITPEVAARAFEAFFTTKDVGQGTGLGLDIARRIVEERHGGSISVERRGPLGSGAGETVFRVSLPLH